MSNLNPDEIYEYQEEERNKPNGLFQVEEIEIIPVENGEEKPSENWYAITSKLDNVNECYPVKDKQTAEELCDQLNVLTMDLMFDKKLPEDIPINCVKGELISLAECINDKRTKLDELATSIENELCLELDYTHKANALRLDPEFIKNDLELSKLPTEKQIQAYIENTLSREFNQWKIAKANTSLLRQQLDYINDRISFEKYCLRLRWNE